MLLLVLQAKSEGSHSDYHIKSSSVASCGFCPLLPPAPCHCHSLISSPYLLSPTSPQSPPNLIASFFTTFHLLPVVFAMYLDIPFWSTKLMSLTQWLSRSLGGDKSNLHHLWSPVYLHNLIFTPAFPAFICYLQFPKYVLTSVPLPGTIFSLLLMWLCQAFCFLPTSLGGRCSSVLPECPCPPPPK